MNIITTTGTLDRVISELLELSTQALDADDCQTLTHHADDMRAAADVITRRASARLFTLLLKAVGH